jgi:hypothetical protein
MECRYDGAYFDMVCYSNCWDDEWSGETLCKDPVPSTELPSDIDFEEDCSHEEFDDYDVMICED